MPTATEYFGFSLVNLGPLTTTFTVPPSCATANSHIVVAESTDLGNVWGPPTCGVQDWGNCLPSGSGIDSIVSQFQKKPIQGFEAFYSPGLVCPSGWTTAGVASHGTGGSLSLEGVFTQPAYGDISNIVAAGMPPKSIILNILDPAETLIYCCPSGYVPNVNGGCHSSIGPMTYSSLCFRAIPDADIVSITSFDGSSWSPILESVTAVSDWTTITETIASTAWPTLVVVTEVLALALIHQPTDLQNAGQTTTSTTSGARPAVARVDAMLLLPIVMVLLSTLTGAALMLPRLE